MPLELLALPAGTAIAILATKAQRRRLHGLLRSAGDVRALVLDCNRQLREWKMHSLSRTLLLAR
jgi:hypothetical protein